MHIPKKVFTKPFATPELLHELILLRLPLLDLLSAEKVSYTWKKIMTNSIDIQQALFFKSYSDIVVEAKLHSKQSSTIPHASDHWKWKDERGHKLASKTVPSPFHAEFMNDYPARAAICNARIIKPHGEDWQRESWMRRSRSESAPAYAQALIYRKYTNNLSLYRVLAASWLQRSKNQGSFAACTSSVT